MVIGQLFITFETRDSEYMRKRLVNKLLNKAAWFTSNQYSAAMKIKQFQIKKYARKIDKTEEYVEFYCIGFEEKRNKGNFR